MRICIRLCTSIRIRIRLFYVDPDPHQSDATLIIRFFYFLMTSEYETQTCGSGSLIRFFLNNLQCLQGNYFIFFSPLFRCCIRDGKFFSLGINIPVLQRCWCFWALFSFVAGWQGSAFQLGGRVAAPPAPPTSCLKVRHMFGPAPQPPQPSTIRDIQREILQRCDSARFGLHLVKSTTRGILVRIRIRGSVPLANGSGSWYFRQWPSRWQLKINFFPTFFCLLLFEATFTSFFIGKKSHRSRKIVRIKVFLTIFAWV